MKRLNIAYFGSPDFSADFLEKLIIDTSIKRLIEVKLVVTQPDQKVGRKQILTPTLVKKVALNFENLKIENSLKIENLKLKIKKLDLVLLYAFGAIIPKELLDLPKLGFWCIHPSILPKYRGTSPMATALINGDKTTGVTIIKMDEKIDHGPIIAQEEYKILPTDKRPDLETKLTDLAFEMFKKTINVIASGAKQSLPAGKQGQKKIASSSSTPRDDILAALTPQQHELASYTKKLTKQDGFIEFQKLKFSTGSNYKGHYSSSEVEKLFNLFRGLYPWPGLWTILPNGKRLKITDMELARNRHACSLQIKRVQLEGKKEVDFETFKKAYKIF